MSAGMEERTSRADLDGAFESEEVGGGEAAISVSKEDHTQDKDESSTEMEEYTTEVETVTREETSSEDITAEEKKEEITEETSKCSNEDLHQDVPDSPVEVVMQDQQEPPPMKSTPDFQPTGFLPWEEDTQMLSAFTDKKEELVSSHAEYMRLHPELRALLADFVQALFIQKPNDVFQFAHDFFRPYHPQATHAPPFPSTS